MSVTKKEEKLFSVDPTIYINFNLVFALLMKIWKKQEMYNFLYVVLGIYNFACDIMSFLPFH